MTELAPAAAPDLIAQRLDMLERWVAERTAAAPRAAPPITIPPYSNVPAPGSPIRSDWPQQITNSVAKNVDAFVGVGVTLTSLSIANGSNPTIAWPSEAYDSHNFHNPGATDLVIPSGWAGMYTATLTLTATGSLTAGPALVRLLINASIKQNTIIQGQSIATVNYTGPLAVGGIVQASCWNASGGAIFFGGSLELIRLHA